MSTPAASADDRRHSLNERHRQILAVLSNAAEPLSTSAIRRQVNKNRSAQLVAEQVYRTLRTLHSRGHIQRLTKEGTTEIYWHYTQPAVNNVVHRDPHPAAPRTTHPEITRQGARQ